MATEHVLNYFAAWQDCLRDSGPAGSPARLPPIGTWQRSWRDGGRTACLASRGAIHSVWLIHGQRAWFLCSLGGGDRDQR